MSDHRHYQRVNLQPLEKRLTHASLFKLGTTAEYKPQQLAGVLAHPALVCYPGLLSWCVILACSFTDAVNGPPVAYLLLNFQEMEIQHVMSLTGVQICMSHRVDV